MGKPWCVSDLPCKQPHTGPDSTLLYPWECEVVSKCLGTANCGQSDPDNDSGGHPKAAQPIILGQDCPEFTQVLQTASLWDPLAQMALKGDPLEGKAKGPKKTNPSDPPTPLGTLDAPEGNKPPWSDSREAPLDVGVNFIWGQREDPTLSQAYEKIAYIGGVAKDPQ